VHTKSTGGDSVSTLHRTVGVASVGLIAAAAFSASPALAKQSCSDVVYSNEAQASGPGGELNAAGVRFTPRGDKFTIWDNQADGRRVTVLWNYAGVNDRWKLAGEPNDGTSDTFQLPALIDERYRSICFGIFKAGPNSPIVRYTTRP
jgi:hypothetical protein